MIIQSFVLPGDVCSERELFYRSESDAEISADGNAGFLVLNRGAVLSSDTYMNFLDKNAWSRYTRLSDMKLVLQLKGTGVVELYEDDVPVQSISFQCTLYDRISLKFNMQEGESCFFKIRAEERTMLYSACYISDEREQRPEEVRLAVLLCTYKREKVLEENLRCLGDTLFFESGSPYYGKMFVYATDNASSIRPEDLLGNDGGAYNLEGFFHLNQSRNLGGSGGFTRCILEMRDNSRNFPATHAVFMDDDSFFIPETFYRLYALLSYIKPEYESEAVAGRMFRMDQKNVQYTASEIWNRGNLKHMGFQEDMSQKENFSACNAERGEYAGWWFAAYPYQYLENQLPLPFFLHCDDVEFGLRHGGSPIVMNGIQVWHDTYEERMSPEIAYYDLRNSMTVNAIYGLLPERETFLSGWKDKITERHVAGDYFEEYILILAMWDFLKGNRYFMRRDTLAEHEKICNVERKRWVKRRSSVLWRMAAMRIRLFYKRCVNTYRVS